MYFAILDILVKFSVSDSANLELCEMYVWGSVNYAHLCVRYCLIFVG
jgi:hypothetical protein